MAREQFEATSTALRNIAGTIAERMRQVGQGAKPPFQFFHDSLTREAARLIANGEIELGDAVLSFRAKMEDADNA